jgi:hypothetical protein
VARALRLAAVADRAEGIPVSASFDGSGFLPSARNAAPDTLSL